jgi:O-acetyl-ADP-ribose deacetylase (regulator of RNase III)
VIRTVNGDLLKANAGIIGHQVNCKGVMGSGVAKQIRNKWPIVFDEYYKFYQAYPNKQLLGKCQFVETKDVIIANLFAQATFGYDGKQYTNYTALYDALVKLRDYAEVQKLTVALPYKIGCDRGGGDWPFVAGYLLELFSDSDLLTLYKMEESK